jgi:beta-galactosidase
VEDYLEVRFTLRSDTNWAKAGHEVAFEQIQLIPAEPLALPKPISASSGPQFKQTSSQVLHIGTPGAPIQWQFNITKSTLSSWQKHSSELIHTPPVLDFFRAETDNDRPSRFGNSWYNSRLHQTQCHVQSVTWEKCKKTGNVVVVVQSRIAPPVLEWSIDTTFTYTFSDRQLLVKVAGKPRGMNLPNSFARIGLTLSLNNVSTAQWFGRGPGEGYWDKKRSQRFGTYTKPIDELFTDYEFPQETGNRTDIRWVEFAGKDKKESLKANFGDLDGASFSALRYTMKDLDECEHPYELYKRKRDETVVRLDWAHHGLGTGSCGPVTLPAYELHCEPFEYEVLLE